ncbi:MAG: rhomboid family intramembrane serine protease [Defluviitaleaceae bacterium]|nr:rhomboid family intramembrane serine protease [Defluviitaleaceae bacterium]MCL2262328.1 rhomboid family intramembrane serine protease [Defluviitaleaceae bacterium]
MFAQFSAHLYNSAASEEYRLAITNGTELSDTTHWVAQKVEMATLVTLHVIDAAKVNMQSLFEYDKNTREGAETLPFGQVANVYVLAGAEPPTINDAEFEEYFGQRVYSIFWHLNLETGEISVPQGQPKKLFNLREMVLSAWHETTITADSEPAATFAEITTRAEKKQRIMPIHRFPVISIALIIFNAAMLGLMYLDGYHAGDVSVAMRFGAIVSDFVIYDGEWYRLFTSTFLHFGFAHFFANAMGILIFGTRLERYLGRGVFCAVYFFSGILGSAFSLAHSYFFHPLAVSAGASGAVYGIVGALFIYTRITKRQIEGIGWYVMLLYIGLGFAIGFATNYITDSTDSTPSIGNFAHLGGLIGGMIIGWAYIALSKKPSSHV